MAYEFITKKNLTDYTKLVKRDINKAQTTANNALTAAGGAMTEAGKKIPKGGLKTINGIALEGSGNIELDFTVAEVVTALPDLKTAVKTKIYLVAASNKETNNSYGEYIKVTVDGTDKWEKLGEYKADMKLTWDAISGKPSTFTPSAHTHAKGEVGLGNVDNTSDAAKPVSTAQQAALDKKTNLSDVPTDTVTNVTVEKATATAVPLGIYKQTKKVAGNVTSFTTGGSQVSIPAATQSAAGVMSAADKLKLDKLAVDAEADENGDLNVKLLGANGAELSSIALPEAIAPITGQLGSGASGVMSATDKAKLDGINFTDISETDIQSLWNNTAAAQ